MEQTTVQGGILKPASRFRGGTGVPHNKHTADSETVRITTPEKVIIPMQQHAGAACVPVVKPGDTVGVGQVIGDSSAYVSAPVHASISGKVSAVRDITLCNGSRVQAVEIESDGEMRLYEGVRPPDVKNPDDFIKAVRASGLVGMGGAGFPTHVKLSPPKQSRIDTLIINAAECEPFITVDYRECLENSWDILSGIYTVQEMLGIDRVIIAIEDNKPEAMKVLTGIAANSADKNDSVRVMQLRSRYPQGAEKVIIQAATGRRVPPGKLPADVGCLVMNVTSIAFIARYLKSGKPLVSRTVTVDGDAVTSPANVRVPLGTRVEDIIEFCGGFSCEPDKLIFGGPMMGIAFTGLEHPVLKNNNAILAFSEKFSRPKKLRACIRCGRCASVCPMSLTPTLIERLVSAGNIQELERRGVSVCMECGSCAYSCPSGRPLVQYMRMAKSMVKNGRSK